MSHGLENLLTLIRRDGRLHDCSFDFQGHGGITFHVSAAGEEEARERLQAHCAMKKHQLRSHLWYGLLLAPSGQVRGATRLSYPWEPDVEVDEVVRDLTRSPVTRRQFAAMRPPKLRPNERCPCGSGLKFKKCCRV